MRPLLSLGYNHVMKVVLLIHDGDVVMHALGLVLREEGYAVETAKSSEETSCTSADLILMDAHSAELERPNAIVDLKLQLATRSPLYLFASNTEEQLQERAQQLGADGYLSTEWGFRRVLSLVRFAVRGKSATQPPQPTDAQFNALNRILVLEDHAGARNRLVLELRNQGYAVAGASDLAELEKLYESMSPDVIVTDVVLGGVSGDQICKQLKGRMADRKIPIVLVSGLPEAELKVRAERAGADGYFCKQRGLPQLIHMLEQLLSEIVF
jgi:two-component system, chemotaxis family, response regulator PixH